jgi:phenylpyruvate tautomerase PptA (4-oxalocrotonate tautomerase family)
LEAVPLHRIFHTPSIFSATDKNEIAARLTDHYTRHGLPPFYVVVIFIPVEAENFFVGGQPANKFVRIISQHFARNYTKEEQKETSVNMLEACFAPYVRDRGLDWEIHIEDMDRSTWHENGLVSFLFLFTAGHVCEPSNAMHRPLLCLELRLKSFGSR